MRIGIRGLARHLLLWAMLSPFLVMSYVAQGVMPVRSPAGTLTLVLCAADGAGTIVIDLATGQPVERAPEAAPERCAWAGAGVVAMTQPRAGLALTVVHPPAPRWRTDPDRPRLPAPAVRPPATGPPSA